MEETNTSYISTYVNWIFQENTLLWTTFIDKTYKLFSIFFQNLKILNHSLPFVAAVVFKNTWLMTKIHFDLPAKKINPTWQKIK